MTKLQLRKWRRYIAALRRDLPTLKPVRIRSCRIADASAVVHDRGKYWEIIIDSRLSWQSRVDSLEHEYAHILDDFPRHDGDYDKEHGPSWGVEFSKCHRTTALEADKIKAERSR